MNPNLLLAAKNIVIGLIFILLSFGLKAQGCLSEGITFTTQEQIDSFPIDYPGCTEIIGGLYIINGQVQNLNGLINITSIGGSLIITGQEGLASLSGLDNLISIGESMEIDHNRNLTNLTGLYSLTTIGNDAVFYGNYGLENFEGLNLLNNIGGRLIIAGNDDLINFGGLQNLITIGAELYIYSNHSLSDLSGLENLTSAGGSVQILYNTNLNNIQALSGITPGSLNQLDIYSNLILNECNIPSICDYLMSPTGVVNIFQNDDGCNNPSEVAESCGFELGCLSYGNYWVVNQQEADNFFLNYPGCTDLKGDLHIGGEELNYVNGLYGINSVEGDLLVQHNYSMNNLNGLESLTTIGGDLYIGGYGEGNIYLRDLTGLENLVNFDGSIYVINNEFLTNLQGLSSIDSVFNMLIACYPSMINLSGLDSLNSINHDLQIAGYSLKNLNGLEKIDSIHGSLTIGGSDSLVDLTGLNNLKHIGEVLRIHYNNSLNNLTGLDNLRTVGAIVIINDDSLTNLHGLDSINSQNLSHILIRDNDILSYCEIENICEYLIGLDGTAEISNNAPGCDTRGEVEAACIVGQNELNQNGFCKVYPNPTSGLLRFSFTLTAPSGISFEIVNCLGQKIKGPEPDNLSSGTHEIIWNASHLPDGIYYYRLQTDSQTASGRIVLAD